VVAAPSQVQMMAVGCQRAFAALTAVTWFERHLVADIFCEPHETKYPHWNTTLLYRHLGCMITRQQIFPTFVTPIDYYYDFEDDIFTTFFLQQDPGVI
jgi:hypothetical protein